MAEALKRIFTVAPAGIPRNLRLAILLLAAIPRATAAPQADTLQTRRDTLSTATVVARSAPQRLKEGAYAVNALNIRAEAGLLNSLSDAIDRTAGIRIREEGGVGSDFDLSINGMSGNSIRYFLDGMPLDTKGSGVTLANLPVGIIDRIEVYKGVVPAAFGSDALGGAVNIVTTGTIRDWFDISLGAGSFHTYKGDFSASFTIPRTGIAVRPVIGVNDSRNDYIMRDVKIRNAERTDFIITDCPRFHDRYRSLFAQIEAGVVGRSWADEFFVGGNFSTIYKELQTGATQSYVYGMAERSSRASGLSARYSKRDAIVEGLDVNLAFSHTRDHSCTIDTTYRRYYWDGTWIDGAFSEIRGRGKTMRHYLRPMDVARMNLAYELSEGHELALAYLFNRTGNRQYDDVDTGYTPSEDFLYKHVASLSYNQTLLEGRLENTFFVKDYINSLAVGQTELSSRTGASQAPPASTKSYLGYGAGSRFLFSEEIALKGSLEHSIRLPLSREVLGNGATVYPNLILEPEISNNFNLGLFGSWQPAPGHTFSYDFNTFLRLVDNYIQATVSEQEGMMQYVNVAAVHIKGVDGEISYDWNGQLRLFANASFDDSRDQRRYTQAGKPSVTYLNRTPNKPWAFLNAGASYSFRQLLSRSDRLRIGLNYRWVHWFYLTWEAYGSASTKSRIPTQHNFDASLLYSWAGGRHGLSLECTNLFDALAYDNYMLQKPGRGLFLKYRLFIQTTKYK